MIIAIHLLGAICWFSFAFGFVTPQPWVVVLAFILVGLQSLIAALNAIVGETA